MPARPLLTTLSEEERAAALDRVRLLQPFLDGEVQLTRLARDHGIPLRTARRWLMQYRRDGLAGLGRKPRGDRGTHRFPDELIHLIEGLALRRPVPSIASVHRAVTALAAEQGWDVPSYSSVYAIIRGLDPGLRTLAHDGARAYKERFDLLYRREVDRPNAVWLGDHTPLDITVRDERDDTVRPWLTVILDDYSRAVASYRLSIQPPSTQQIALTLRQAIWRKSDPRWPICGIPDSFYTDNGADFASHHMEQVGIDLKMALLFSFPGEPRGRGRIERFFNTVNQLFLSALPGYTPPGRSGQPRAEAQLTVEELDRRPRCFFLETYHHRRHGETRMTPLERWEAGGFLPRMPESLEQLDLLLLTVAKGRRVQQDGIRFQGLRYMDATLAPYVGETVLIRYDPLDLAEIRVFVHDRFLCRAICAELADREIGLSEIVQARRARRQELRSTLHARSSLVDAIRAGRDVAPAAPTPDTPTLPRRSRLKRYRND
jgi:putative transposase